MVSRHNTKGENNMRIYDIIAKKRDKGVLTKQEIEFFVEGYTSGEIKDYQASALLMAICINGMNSEETAYLTMAMANSGEMADLSGIKGIKIDKHSTGGVGDKTSLIVGPIVASFGVPVAKMSGRGLGHTGGTIDKLESISGFNIAIEKDDFVKNVNDIKLSIVGQTGNLAPADKKLYALRDVTATVDSIPLIASSIMSKKIAGGADAIVLDVKYGKGAFMQTVESANDLATAMVNIGRGVGRKVVAVITSMEEPLGNYIGNALEIKEVVATLKGNGPKDLEEVCFALAKEMLILAGIDEEGLDDRIRETITSGRAYDKFKEFVARQGGDVAQIENLDLLPSANINMEVYPEKEGYINEIDTKAIGTASGILGGGRISKEDTIDYGVGIIINKKIGEYVGVNTPIATIQANNLDKIEDAKKMIKEAYVIADKKKEPSDLIWKIIKECE